MEIYLNQFYDKDNFPHQYYYRGDIGSDIHITDRNIDVRVTGHVDNYLPDRNINMRM